MTAGINDRLSNLHTHTHVQVWSHMPLSPSATLQHSGGPPSRKRYTHREFLQLSMGDESDMEPDDVLGEGVSRGEGGEGGGGRPRVARRAVLILKMHQLSNQMRMKKGTTQNIV